MRSIDFAPFYRSSIGFDRMLDLLGSTERPEAQESWPPYDIERADDDHYRITLALAGFAREELSVTTEANTLVVEGSKGVDDANRNFLHRGIAQRGFRRQFDLADFVKVTGASYEHGLLSIELEREVPEAMRPRRIEINASSRAAHARREEKRVESPV